MCQRFLWSYLINLLGTLSTDYFLLLLAITEQSPYFLPDSSLIAIGISHWYIPGCYQYIVAYQFVHLHEEDFSHTHRQNLFTNWNFTWYSWVGKTLDIVASGILSTYDIDKTQNSTLNIPWFHTPAFNLSWNGHATMGNISEWKLARTKILRIFGGSFVAHPWPNILTKHNIKETASISYTQR